MDQLKPTFLVRHTTATLGRKFVLQCSDISRTKVERRQPFVIIKVRCPGVLYDNALYCVCINIKLPPYSSFPDYTRSEYFIMNVRPGCLSVRLM